VWWLVCVVVVHYGCYFPGMIRSFNARSGTHHVVYDDGDEEDIVLRAADVMWDGGSGGSNAGGGGKDGRSGDCGGGSGSGDGLTVAGTDARQERTLTSQFRGVSWNRRKQRWHGFLKHSRKDVYLGYFDEEEDAARAYDRMMVWFELHGIVRNKPNSGVHDSRSVKKTLNFAYDEYMGEFDELRRMTQEECVQSLRQQAKDKRKRPESMADKHLALGDGGQGGDGVMIGGRAGAGGGGGGGGGDFRTDATGWFGGMSAHTPPSSGV